MPEITLVMAGSNDDYGGEVYREVETTPTSHFKDRCARCIYTIHKSFRDLDYEVVFVIWNEDSARESILSWEFLKHNRIRLIVVPPEVARSVEPDRQFHETWAKNIGIRRARSETILSTNPDVMWLDDFPRSLLGLDSAVIAQRWTLNKSVLDVGFNMEKLREYSQNPSTRRNLDWGSNGDFTMMPKSLWFELKGLCTPKQEAMAGVDQWQVRRAEQVTGRVLAYPHPIYHCEHPGRKLSSSYSQTVIREDWGFPDIEFSEHCSGN